MSSPAEPVFSVVLSTYNRGALLVDAVRSLLALDPASPPHEIIVVDNNSRDHTREVVQSLIPESGGRLRYVFEGKQGLSNARNAGVAASRGRIVAFTDDDVRANPDWLIALGRAFDAHPDAAYGGGKVLPMWPSDPPAWLTDWFWSPLALSDYGPEGRYVDRHDYVTIVGANLAVRREVFDAHGGFDPRYQHEPGAVTACEDHEFEMRLVNAGLRGWYEPSAVIRAEVQANRLTLAYHRKWAFDHGRAVGRMTPPGYLFDGNCTLTPRRTTARTLLGGPGHAWKAVARHAWGYLGALARRDRPGTLWWQFKLLGYFGELHYYVTTRRRDPQSLAMAGEPPRIPPSRWADAPAERAQVTAAGAV